MCSWIIKKAGNLHLCRISSPPGREHRRRRVLRTPPPLSSWKGECHKLRCYEYSFEHDALPFLYGSKICAVFMIFSDRWWHLIRQLMFQLWGGCANCLQPTGSEIRVGLNFAKSTIIPHQDASIAIRHSRGRVLFCTAASRKRLTVVGQERKKS